MLKAREAWPRHLNFVGSTTREAQEAFNVDMLANAIRGACEMFGRAVVLEILPEIMARHVRNLDPG